MRKASLILQRSMVGITLILGLACGGGHTSSAPAASAANPAKGLSYTDPVSTGWRLVKDGTSTPTRLVLNLVGPSELNTRGAGFNLKAAAGIRFGTFPETAMPVKDGGVYELLNVFKPTHDPLEPVAVFGGLKAGNLLTVGVFQKDRQASAKASGGTLLQIALELEAAGTLAAGDKVPLTVMKARYIPEDLGAYRDVPSAEMVAKGHLVDLSLAVGTLSAN